MKVLIVAGDLWHPMEVIQRGIKSFPERIGEYELDFVEAAKDILTPEMIREYAVIIVAKGLAVTSFNSAPWFEDTVTEVRAQEFEEYIREGGGFIALHSGNCNKKEANEAYYRINGNSFIGHPLRCPVEFKVTAEHPVTAGVHDFAQRDEHYMIEDVAEDAQVFLKSYSQEGGEQIAGYTRDLGEGRVCVLTPGHTLAVWQDPNFQTMLMNAIDYCAKR